jgi:hypothetical protein
MKKRIAEKSRQEGYRQSRLPEFTEEEVKYIRGKRYQTHLESQLYLHLVLFFWKPYTWNITKHQQTTFEFQRRKMT